MNWSYENNCISQNNHLFQTPARRLLKMSIKAKLSTCIKKLQEATEACKALNALDDDTNVKSSEAQFFFVLDTGKKSHLAGYGRMFENFVENQKLQFFSGEGTTPVKSVDPNHRKCLLQMEDCETKRSTRKRKKSSGSKYTYYFHLLLTNWMGSDLHTW